MIKRPNINARCFQHNLTARTPRNRYYLPRDHKLYIHSRYWCRWCRRPHGTWDWWLWPHLCRACTAWIFAHGGADTYMIRVDTPYRERPS